MKQLPCDSTTREVERCRVEGTGHSEGKKEDSSRIMTYITKVKSNLGNYPDIRVRNGLDELQNSARHIISKFRVEVQTI